MDFSKEIQPILETSCVSCHSGEEADGELWLDTRQGALTGGSGGPALFPSKSDESSLYIYITLPADDDLIMPPDGPLEKTQIERIKQWIDEGAEWPRGLVLSAKEKTRQESQAPDNQELVQQIWAKIHKHSVETAQPDMKVYQEKIPKTGVEFWMQPIPGGKFLMGSPSDEPLREADEGPQTQVTVAPFWMGRQEVTWDEYEPYMITKVDRHKNGARKDYDPVKHGLVDAISQPTAPYMEMSFGMGQSGYPAISMTQHAASKYCEWLSAQTGHFYRLPTEAEWEYACRAGSTTAYSFGDNSQDLDQYAWYYDNSNEKYQKVGEKKPNPWGLYDMHGNVSEWTLDQFLPDYFTKLAGDAKNPFIKPKTLYPRTVRGGSWDSDPEHLRSAYRIGSDSSWKQQDPQLPKSIWYHTDARWLGFRIVRPLEIPSAEEMDVYWNSAVNKR
ncbi:SUMF1/EgtB/PvdO family nonheme iron enzyme [Bythopirellula goksoeyrii]|uniref:SUMF1/EgtB/PvdO family nonheme iron enzyme n=1 Tax=Bythopirellula goksoeyrii TaxID=1400387 RepID=UPI001EE5130C|nr:SUMF1/EgtB/PvdO family nonheme iron enzyme [Bythopirellula goksoeyrii]